MILLTEAGEPLTQEGSDATASILLEGFDVGGVVDDDNAGAAQSVSSGSATAPTIEGINRVSE